MAKHRNPFAQQAADLSLVRYGPEVSALTALLRQAQTDLSQRTASARSGAQLIQSSVDAARPDIQGIYDTAGQQATAAQQIAAPQLAALPAGSPFAAAAALEQSGLATRLAGARAGALTDLTQERIGAAQGAVGETQAAQRAYAQARGQIGQRAQDLAQEQGAFTASTIQDLMSADAKAQADAAKQQASLTQSERNSVRSSGIDPDTGQPIPGGKLDPNAPKNKPKPTPWANPKDQAAAANTLHSALDEIKSLKADSPNLTRQQAAKLLLEGADDIPDKEVPVYDPATGKKVIDPKTGLAVTKTIPGVKGVKQVDDHLLVSDVR
jgi:hypothetical protein